MDFEWDEEKAEGYLRKHRVRFDYATNVFLDYQRHDFVDVRDYEDEVRYKSIGLAGADLLIVCYTFRSETIRLISARKANRYERETYWNRKL